MLKLIVYIFVAPVIAGLLVLGLAIRETAGPLAQSGQMMMIAAAAGFVVSIPIALWVAGQINKFTQGKA
ncbi:MAG: hypothetical protein KDJ68_02685 [Rhodobiaceae bacterium]|nr:hypothetical protein [Rhodobiaceae bacterium]